MKGDAPKRTESSLEVFVEAKYNKSTNWGKVEVERMDGYMTVQQAAIKWLVTPRQVQLWCKTNKVCGAKKWGRDWAIPEKAERPAIKHKFKYNKDFED